MEKEERRHGVAARGFTLIELLITIGIIALLSAILLPVFVRSREKAHQSTCLSNMRQISLAVLCYVQDNEETMPNGVNGYVPRPTGQERVWPGEGWAGQCFPYVRIARIYRCPLDTTVPLSPNDQVVSYGLNNNLVGYADQDDQVPSGVSLSAVVAPSRTVLLFEVAGVLANVVDPREGADNDMSGTHFSASGNGLDNRLYAQKDWSTRTENQYATGYLGGRKPFNPQATQFSSPLGRHTAGANYAFIDGHVGFLIGIRVSAGRNASASYCAQDNSPSRAGCDGLFQAAGTADPAFGATFSIL